MNKDLSKVLRDLRRKNQDSSSKLGINLNIGEDGVLKMRGDDGYTPVKGVDYWTPEEIDGIVTGIFNAAKPKLGVDYYTPDEKRQFVSEVLKLATPVKGKDYKDGYTPIKGKDYFDGKDAEPLDPKTVAIDAINFLETFEGDARLSAKALKDLDEAVTDILSKGFDFELSENQIKTIKDLLPKYPPLNAGGSGATFLKSLRDVDLSGLTKNADGKYVLGGGGAGSGIVETVVAGTGISVDNTDPANPIVSALAAGGWTVVSGNTTAVLDGQYNNVASATYTDPAPTEGKGYIVFVRNGTATIGGTGYSTAGTIVHRIYHSGAWSNYVYQVSSTFALASHTHTASQVTDFDTEVSNNTDVSAATSHIANTSNPHSVTATQVGLGNVDNTSDATKNAATVTLQNKTLDNTNTISVKDTLFTLQDDADTTKQARFELSTIASGATRTYTLPNSSGTVLTATSTATVSSKSIDLASNTVTTTKALLNTAVSDGDVLFVGDVTTNATHTGEVTGSGALTVDKTAITNKTTVTPVAGDFILFSDTSDSGNLKKADFSDFGGGGGGSSTSVFTNQTPDNGTYALLSGTVNGSNTVFTVNGGIYTTGTLTVYLNGQLQTQGASNDWQETTPASGTFTFITAPQTGDIITVQFQTTASAPTSLTTTEIEVDFGTQPVTSKRFTITDAGVTGTTKIMAVSSGTIATDRVGDDYEWDSVAYACRSGTGTFTLLAKASGRIRGKRKVYYTTA